MSGPFKDNTQMINGVAGGAAVAAVGGAALIRDIVLAIYYRTPGTAFGVGLLVCIIFARVGYLATRLYRSRAVFNQLADEAEASGAITGVNERVDFIKKSRQEFSPARRAVRNHYIKCEATSFIATCGIVVLLGKMF